jgi:presenilin-like A22 family membrane protease
MIMSKPTNYMFHIAISTLIFIFVIAMALFTSQAFGNSATVDAIAVSGISDNQSWSDYNNQQMMSTIAASSLQKIPPNSEREMVVGIILGLVFACVALFVVARYFNKIIVRALFVVSLWSLISIFFSALGYTIFGANVFNFGYLAIIFGISTTLVILWLVYPEWWVVTTIAILMACAGASFFGSSFSPTSVIFVLIALSIYDYVAVIRTKFMVKFAKKVMSIQLPAAITLPYSKDSSLITDGIEFGEVKERSERGFMILGTGDLLFPTVLAVSAAVYSSMTDGIIVGVFIIISYLIMMYTMYFSKYSTKIQALPGLPFLCTGAIIGYIITLL